MSKAVKLKAWFTLSKPLTHVLGALPFILGAVMAQSFTGHFDWPVFIWSIIAALLIMLVACYSGEYFDFETDTLAAPYRNRFSGGTQVLQTGIIPKSRALIAAFICLAGAGAIGLLLQFYYNTGPLTIPLGLAGMVAAFFYSTRPIQWAYMGLGEIWIWFAYGWLCVAAAFYLQTGNFHPLVHYAGLPIGFSIFNVILINEFPDYLADKQVGKKNLVVRFGKEKMTRLYTVVTIAVIVFYFLAVWAGVPAIALLFFAPFMLLSLLTAFELLGGKYKKHKTLERLCAQTILVNWGTSISLAIAFAVQ